MSWFSGDKEEEVGRLLVERWSSGNIRGAVVRGPAEEWVREHM
jgi:hypothetical protein